MTASLLTQERPNIFTQKVANIEPGKAIDIEITYFNTLAYSEGEYTFVFPMVVGPRFNPPGSSEGVGAVGRSAAGKSGQKTEVQYLRPGERSGHDIMVTVDLDAAVELEKTYSSSHAIDVEKQGKTSARVRLRPADTLPNKDFVLRYKVAGRKVKSALMVDRDDRGGMEVSEMYPKSIPDLFVGRPVIVTGRFRGHGETTVRIKGRCAGEPQEMKLKVALDSREARHPGISRIWARARIADLSDAMATGGPASLRDQIRETALTYGLMSPYTAFVAVDSTRRTAGDFGTTVNVPVPVPVGVKYETTVRD